MAWTWMLVFGIAVMAPVVVAHYVAQLPYAPSCPHCRAVTAQHERAGLFDRFCALAAATPRRRCTRCGWAGRMRWRLAAERARGRTWRRQ